MTYVEPEMITIIEGPPPEFMLAPEIWPMSLWEGTLPKSVAVCQMRTFNAGSLMERCTRAWREGRPVHLDFPQMDGLRQKAEVLAARPGHVEEGDLLYLWVVVPHVVPEDIESNEAADDDDDFSAYA